jgi:hypothetical protein
MNGSHTRRHCYWLVYLHGSGVIFVSSLLFAMLSLAHILLSLFCIPTRQLFEIS